MSKEEMKKLVVISWTITLLLFTALIIAVGTVRHRSDQLEEALETQTYRTEILQVDDRNAYYSFEECTYYKYRFKVDATNVRFELAPYEYWFKSTEYFELGSHVLIIVDQNMDYQFIELGV